MSKKSSINKFLCIFFIILFSILISLSIILILIFILPGSPGYLEVYDVQDGGESWGLTWGGRCNICYLRWHGRKTTLNIEDMWSGQKWKEIVNDGDTFTLTIPLETLTCGWVEIRYDHTLISVYSWGELKEKPWYE